MSKTKKKIILAAIDLFNEHGMDNVRNQDIAIKAGMSLSNFNYHYGAKKELFLDIVAYMTEVLNERVYGSNAMLTQSTQGYAIAKDYFEFEIDFKFFYEDTYNILQQYPEIRGQFEEQIVAAINMIKNVNYIAIGKGYLKPAPADFPDLYDHLSLQIWINNHFWLAQNNILGRSNDIVGDGIRNIYLISYPYLTEKGKSRFSQYKSMVV